VEVEAEEAEVFGSDPGPLARPVEEEVEFKQRIKCDTSTHTRLPFQLRVYQRAAAHTTCLVSLRVPQKTQQELTKTSINLSPRRFAN
jgi:hypothetical protein